jgi:hypothetical protein
MKRTATLLLACIALGLAAQAGAQSISPAWDAYRKQQKARQQPPPSQSQPISSDDHTQATLPAGQAGARTHMAPASAPVPAPAKVRPRKLERVQSGAFVGVQGGKGWVYEDIDQNMIGFNAGYRWRAGAVTLVGIEVAGGQLDRISDHDGFYAPAAQFGSVGGTARFNFGDSPMFATARLGYWSGKSKDDTYDDRVYGAYVGVGLGVDLGRHASVRLGYTGFIYANSYDDYDDQYLEVNRADMVDLGFEVRF